MEEGAINDQLVYYKGYGWFIIEKLKLEGCGILLIAEDLDSIFRYCDRIMVMYRGKVMGICDTDKTNITDIGMMMMGTPLEEVRRYEEYGHF